MAQITRSDPSRRVLVALVAALCAAAVVAAPAGARSLRRHDKGPTVAHLQRLLQIIPDGLFGAGTAAAVKLFQRHHHLIADGRVGAETWRMLRRADARHGAHRPARPGPARRAAPIPRPGGGLPLRVTWAIAAADRIAGLPYLYGGGHDSFASFASTGLDCSGSVSYVLHAARALEKPMDSSQLETYGAPGPGRWITVYANPGHAFMTVNGRRFDTSGQSATGSRWQPDARSADGYVIRHPPGL